MMTGQPPEFVKPTLNFDRLNDVARQAYQQFEIEGGESTQGPGGYRFVIPKPPDGFWARIWLVADTGSASGLAVSEQCSGKNRYAFQELTPEACGETAEFDDQSYAGDGDTVVAYEVDNNTATDDSTQWLTRWRSWWDDEREEWIEEWIFAATASSLLGRNTGRITGSASGDDTCSGGTPLSQLIQCSEDGTQIQDVCLKITDAEGNPFDNLRLTPFDSDGNIVTEP